ncbi:S-adenosyl-L-methionine-dependent methyltransferase [Polyplosphaeria fusca]|uniref:S-adenosyl-L-methionine-dependent methyltransferase n=1 Tax=Polyplosphaeria fusca TaxID=682080 RepID=A0A9P4R9P7_9PLEO|nr:S-adenosyl-L-methionine-dependent methyltransferase [Polyplosphaeria fusca]
MRGGHRSGNRNRGRGAFRGGRGGKNRNARDTRTEPWSNIPRENMFFESYYRRGIFMDEHEFEAMWKSMASDLPNSFRFTGTKSDALAVREIFKKRYIPNITSVTFDGEPVEPPRAVSAFPDELVWDMKTHKKVIRRFPPFAEFQKFLVAEAASGNISRQEVVSMIPPHFLDVKPGMVVLDMCAAPGSKSAQLAEMIHGDEEDRVKNAAANTPFDSEGGDYSDDGRSTGLLIANDTDYKRAGMLVHQVKRLNFPNLIVTQHDAAIFPSIELPSAPGQRRQFLKFDRILADVPCSGDGTARKNINVWQKWTPKDGLGLHNLQLRILFRGLQMLKKGGRLVYSTCSMNPVENEAVIASAIEACGGNSKVQLVECSDLLPGLIRRPGLNKWKVFDTSALSGGQDKKGHLFTSWEAFCTTKEKFAKEDPDRSFSPKMTEGVFPRSEAAEEERIPLERCMRVYPHLQDTGAFFIAVLEKKDDIKIAQIKSTHDVAAPTQSTQENSALPEALALKRKLEDADEDQSTKRSKTDDESEENIGMAMTEDDQNSELPASSVIDETPEPPVNGSTANKSADRVSAKTAPTNLQPSSQKQIEYFEYLPADDPIIADIFDFFGVDKRFPRDRFLVRNKDGLMLNKVYYTSELTKTVITMNKDRGMRFVHCGVIMFVSHKIKTPDQLKCPWRLQDEGIKILAPWASKRIIECTSKMTLYKLLVEMFPKLNQEGPHHLNEVGDQLQSLEPGCSFMKVEKSEGEDGFPFDMVFPLWRHPGSVNLMVDKEDRKATLLRLFNEKDPVIKNHVADKAAEKALKEKENKQDEGEKADETSHVEANGMEISEE